MTLYKNRTDAGHILASRLKKYAGRSDVLILALPRGGVPVAYEVARALQIPMDLFLVRKLGVPGHEELAMGAIATGGVRVVNEDIVRGLNIPDWQVDRAAEREMEELRRRERAYRGSRPLPDVRGKTVILIDDGLATGASMYAAITALRKLDPARIVMAVPTAAEETCAHLERFVDETICAATPRPFQGVGLWYDDFSQVSDDQVREFLYLSEKATVNVYHG